MLVFEMEEEKLSNTALAQQLASDLTEFHAKDLQNSSELDGLDKTVTLLLNQLEDFKALQV